LGERWTLTLGGRLYDSEVGGKADMSGLLPALQVGGGGAVDLSVKDKGFNPKAALVYQATDDVMFYGSASRGFQYGGVNILLTALPGVDPTVPPTYKSSTLWNYELGFRSDWFDRTLRFDMTAFYIDWSDAQVTQGSKSGLSTYVDNVASATGKGLEAAFRYRFPIRGLSLSTAASYIDTESGSSFTDGATGKVIPAGTQMPLAPKVQVSNVLAYSTLLGNWSFGSELLHSYQGTSYSTLSHAVKLNAYNTLGASFTVGRPDLPLEPSLTLLGDNLTNEHAIVYGVSSASGGIVAPVASTPFTYNRPRSIGLRLNIQF
ncbi:MAG: TonB-dependent receptor, partial [Solimonas sp.]